MSALSRMDSKHIFQISDVKYLFGSDRRRIQQIEIVQNTWLPKLQELHSQLQLLGNVVQCL